MVVDGPLGSSYSLAQDVISSTDVIIEDVTSPKFAQPKALGRITRPPLSKLAALAWLACGMLSVVIGAEDAGLVRNVSAVKESLVK